jgi:hypothetical protein
MLYKNSTFEITAEVKYLGKAILNWSNVSRNNNITIPAQKNMYRWKWEKSCHISVQDFYLFVSHLKNWKTEI